jgi:radical SAM superfamily enzyme YgiQ (UPF0313 family)
MRRLLQLLFPLLWVVAASTYVVSGFASREARHRPHQILFASTSRAAWTTSVELDHDPTISDTTIRTGDNVDTVVGGALSRTVVELAPELGNGLGRARLAWDCYRIGVDPATETTWDTAITKFLPSGRRTQRLGVRAQQQLAQLHQRTCGGAAIDRVDGGVAKLVHQQSALDGTTKLLLELHDKTMVETVIIPWNDNRSTLCISSQVGCRQGCTFCATGKMGKVRSLSTDEILAQMFFARKLCRLHPEILPPVTNVVFMGMVRYLLRYELHY